LAFLDTPSDDPAGAGPFPGVVATESAAKAIDLTLKFDGRFEPLGVGPVLESLVSPRALGSDSTAGAAGSPLCEARSSGLFSFSDESAIIASFFCSNLEGFSQISQTITKRQRRRFGEVTLTGSY
jgi:hypothetical protein